MMTYKQYTGSIIVLCVLFIVTGLLSSFYFHLEQLDGDLTRLGWFSEYNFGHEGKERYFNPVVTQKGDIKKTYDIIILGDSFTNKPPFDKRWHNLLLRDTGLTIGVFNLRNWSLDKLLASADYKAHPPKLLIYQSVERALKSRFYTKELDDCNRELAVNNLKPLSIKPKKVESYLIGRDKELSHNIGYGLKFLWRKVSPASQVVVHELTSDILFSSRKSGELLTYSDDMKKAEWSHELWQSFRCKMRSIQKQVESNNYTRLLVMIAPDKLTAYAPFLKEKALRNISQYNSLITDDDLNILPLLTYYHDAIEKGEKDLYLPNDTHWSSAGSELATKAVMEYLYAKGVIVKESGY